MSAEQPRLLGWLPGGIPLREPWPSELEFFKARSDVSGMAADDGAVVLNPLLDLSPPQQRAVALNEAARVLMFTIEGLCPNFELTTAQRSAFEGYGPEAAIKATVAARILTGDPSALSTTHDQLNFADALARAMGFAGCSDTLRYIQSPEHSWPHLARQVTTTRQTLT